MVPLLLRILAALAGVGILEAAVHWEDYLLLVVGIAMLAGALVAISPGARDAGLRG